MVTTSPALSTLREIFRQSIVLAALALFIALPTVQATVDTLRVNGGTDRVVVPNAPELNPSGAVTIEAWVRQTTNAGCQTVLGKNYITGYWLGLCEGKIRYYPNGAGSGTTGFAVVPVGEWTHVAVTFDGSTRTYYVNGIVDQTAGAFEPFPVNLDSIGIGGEATNTCGSNTCPFLGDIAEVRLWDIARTQGDIRSDIVKQIEIPREGLVAVWHLEGGPGEAFGNFDGVVDGGAIFGGFRAPPVGESPLRIPRIGTPALDGLCDGVNGPLRIPVWNEGPVSGIEWLYLGATSDHLYVCLQGMPVPPAGAFAAVYVDPTNDATEYANPDDFRLRLHQDGAFFSEAGTGSGGYSGPGPVGAAAQEFFFEFDWQAEFRIPRSLLEMGPDGSFGLQVIDDQDNSNSTSGDWGWPVGYFWDWPAFYESVVIDDSLIPTPDDDNPLAYTTHGPLYGFPDGTTELRAVGRDDDDSGVASITLHLDFNPLLTCNEEPGTTGWRECPTIEVLSPGRHHIHAVVTDHAGRSTTSPADSFLVQVDGDDPRLVISANPLVAPAGGSSTVTVTATDPAGITSISINEETCTFPGTNTVESCVRSVTGAPGQLVRSVYVQAVDSEGLSAAATRRILFGNTGPDSDGDGLSDDVEEVLCTSGSSPDTDGDSLSDKWEVLGVSFPDGDFVDLPNMGANPCHRDVFLQYDYETGARVGSGVIEDIVAAYRRNDITLHVEEKEHPRPTSDPVSEIEAAAASAMVDSNGDYYFPPKHNWTHYYAYSRHNVGTGTAGYRFFTLNTYSGGDDCECPLSGIDPSTCGRSYEEIPTGCERSSDESQHRIFMHELGHIMGLGHGGRTNISSTPTIVGEYVYYTGGWDSVNFKPNYRSIMNYRYNGNLCLVPDSESGLHLVADFDYASEPIGALFETSLDERVTSPLVTNLASTSCPMAQPDSVPVIIYSCQDSDENADLDIDLGARRTYMLTDGVQTRWRRMHGSTWSESGWNSGTPDGIDWNCDGAIDFSVTGSVHGALPDSDEICGDGINTNGDDETDEDDCYWPLPGADGPLWDNDFDWQHIPRPAGCILPYSERRDCYPQPAGYRAEIAASAALDCRPAGDPVADCVPGGGRFAMRGASGPYEIIEEGDFLELPPNTEMCDGRDNDGDLAIDEGCRDTDSDTVSDAIDNCPAIANASQSDTDRDGVGDACDALVMGPLDVTLLGGISALSVSWSEVPGATGYSVHKSTNGGDFSYQSSTDAYPSTISLVWLDSQPAGLFNWQYRIYPVDASGEEGTPSEIMYSSDDDLDGVTNSSDNCLLIANPGQLDTDGDNIGNACDADIAPATNDCFVNFLDLTAMSAAFFSNPVSPSWNPDADFNGDNFVNFADLTRMSDAFFSVPGPSGIDNGC